MPKTLLKTRLVSQLVLMSSAVWICVYVLVPQVLLSHDREAALQWQAVRSAEQVNEAREAVLQQLESAGEHVADPPVSKTEIVVVVVCCRKADVDKRGLPVMASKRS